MIPDIRPMTDALAIYLNDHLAGATAGVELFRRAAGSAQGERQVLLEGLVPEIEVDRAALLDIMASLDVPVRHYKVAAGWLGEKAGRFKLNGKVAGRAPLSSLIEAEGMLLGVRGKAAAWQSLRIVAETDPRLSVEQLDDLIERADRQSAVLERLRRDVAAEVLVGQ